MLRCRDEHVEPGFVHETVEQSGIEGRVAVSRRVEHGPISGGKGFGSYHQILFEDEPASMPGLEQGVGNRSAGLSCGSIRALVGRLIK